MLKEPCKGYGLVIQFVREGKGLSVSELALRTGTSPRFIEDAESSKVHPSDAFIDSLARALEMSEQELYGRIWCEDHESCSMG
jgi:transcriptional regulator with XRE-family HTH domain